MSAVIDEEAHLLGDEINKRHLGVSSAIFLILNRIIGTGIFSIPSSIYQLTGCVGWSLALWIIGGLVAACGFTVYLELGLQMPHSGGEKNYLERIYYWPPRLALTVFSVSAIILSFSTSNSYAFGNYVQLGLGHTPDEYKTRWIAIVTVATICLLHARFPEQGRKAFNYLGMAKVFILVLIAICGPLLALGIIDIDGGAVARHNFGENLWKNDGFGGGLYDVSVALLRISYSFRGWETCNLVMGEVKNPKRTTMIAGVTAVVGITALYSMCTYAYFSIIPKEEVADSGVVIAGVFLLKLFGESAAARLLPLVICLSNMGNILVVTYAASRVTREVGRHNILPFSKILASGGPWDTPLAGLALHLLMTILTLTLPPPGDVYNFVIDTSTYPVTVFATLITLGLLVVHRKPKEWNWKKGYRAPTIPLIIFAGFNLIVLVFPWVPPPIKKEGLPYYAAPLASLVVLLSGIVYWVIFKHQIVTQENITEEEDSQ